MNDVTELVFAVLGRALTNELINQPANERDYITILQKGSLYDNKKEIES
jgi:hypothetical protein